MKLEDFEKAKELLEKINKVEEILIPFDELSKKSLSKLDIYEVMKILLLKYVDEEKNELTKQALIKAFFASIDFLNTELSLLHKEFENI